jgi:hypothetical protein
MYSTVFKSDPLDPVRGDRYRRSILLPGGSREELDSLKVREVISSIDVETYQVLGIPRAPPKSRCIYGGNIREFVDEEIPSIPRLVDTLYWSFSTRSNLDDRAVRPRMHRASRN